MLSNTNIPRIGHHEEDLRETVDSAMFTVLPLIEYRRDTFTLTNFFEFTPSFGRLELVDS
jgi:hypothetical protein